MSDIGVQRSRSQDWFATRKSTNLALMIPQDKNAAVFRALHEAFGASHIEDICRMTKGLSWDLVFRIVVQGSPFLLRIMTRIDERNDPVRQFTCMKAAAEAGLAPRVRYTNAEDGISI